MNRFNKAGLHVNCQKPLEETFDKEVAVLKQAALNEEIKNTSK